MIKQIIGKNLSDFIVKVKQAESEGFISVGMVSRQGTDYVCNMMESALSKDRIDKYTWKAEDIKIIN